MALKKKRMYEQQLEQVENSLLRLSEQQMGLEGVRATAETVAAMHAGAQAGRAVTTEFGVERVDALLDEVADQAEAMRQVSDVLGQPLGPAADIDEDEVAAELEVSRQPSRRRPLDVDLAPVFPPRWFNPAGAGGRAAGGGSFRGRARTCPHRCSPSGGASAAQHSCCHTAAGAVARGGGAGGAAG
jgi:hypothetical protein